MRKTTNTLTDDELATAISKAHSEAQHAADTARGAAEQTGLADLQAEQERRAAEARDEAMKNRTDWAEWFLDGGGYNHLKTQLNIEEKNARDEFLTALRESPLAQAAANYFAAVDNRQQAIDLREEASSLLQRPFNATVLTNRTDLLAESVTEIQRLAGNITAEKWDTLKAGQTDDGEHRQWALNGKAPEERTEEYLMPGPEDYGKPVRIRHNLTTGVSEILDEAFITWQQARKDEDRETAAAPPYWTERTDPTDGPPTGEQTRQGRRRARSD